MPGGRASPAKGSSFEREVAGFFGCIRTPLSGAAGGNDLQSDNSCLEGWGVECKRRKELPKSITKGLAQAEAAMKPGERPLLVMREDRGRMVVVLYGEDFRYLLESLSPGAE